MTRLLQSFVNQCKFAQVLIVCVLQASWIICICLGLLITWPVQPVLALLRVKTPVRRWLLRHLPGGELY